MLKKIYKQLNFVGQCRRYGISLWQCPQFLFLIMGLIIIIVSVVFYLIGGRYITEPPLVAFIDIIITAVLFIIAFIISQSFERVAEASQMKSEFIDIVSHQLRSPITSVKWIADFLSSEDIKAAPAKKKEYLNVLNKNINRMTELVDSLLFAAKIEQGNFPIKKKEGSLAELLKNSIARSKPFAEASGVKIEFYFQPGLSKLFFDPSLMKLVVENLIDNAIRYSKKGSKIEIRLERHKNNLLFKIKDKGVGIVREDQKHIFNKFFRSESPLKEKTKGSGLGLFIAKSIIKKSGGKIWFESQEGEGTTFYFNLPIK